MMIEQVISFARNNNYVDVEFLNNWRGYDVYQPIGDEGLIVGPPWIILVKDNEIRMSTKKEAFDYIDDHPDDEDDDEEENEEE